MILLWRAFPSVICSYYAPTHRICQATMPQPWGPLADLPTQIAWMPDDSLTGRRTKVKDWCQAAAERQGHHSQFDINANAVYNIDKPISYWVYSPATDVLIRTDVHIGTISRTGGDKKWTS